MHFIDSQLYIMTCFSLNVVNYALNNSSLIIYH